MTAAVIDSSGWLEFFTGGAQAETFRDAILAARPLIVPSIVLYEVYKVMARELGGVAAAAAVEVMRRNPVIDLTADLAVAAAILSAQHRLPMADSVIIATARQSGATLWTMDIDFAGSDGVRYLPKA